MGDNKFLKMNIPTDISIQENPTEFPIKEKQKTGPKTGWVKKYNEMIMVLQNDLRNARLEINALKKMDHDKVVNSEEVANIKFLKKKNDDHIKTIEKLEEVIFIMEEKGIINWKAEFDKINDKYTKLIISLEEDKKKKDDNLKKLEKEGYRNANVTDPVWNNAYGNNIMIRRM